METGKIEKPPKKSKNRRIREKTAQFRKRVKSDKLNIFSETTDINHAKTEKKVLSQKWQNVGGE